LPEARHVTYEINVDRVIEPARAANDGRVIVSVAAGSARLRLHFRPRDAMRIAKGITAIIQRTKPGESDG
jgi:hypothetical protein